MKRWYAVHTHPRSEQKALFNLERQGFHAYLPCFAKQRRHARQQQLVSAPLFPRYLFVHMDLDADRWRSVYSSFGVSDVVSAGDQPVPLPDRVIESIRTREGDDGLVKMQAPKPFRSGDPVQIHGGPLAEQTAIFDCEDDNQRVFVLLSLLGRNVRVRVQAEVLSA